MYKQKIRAEEKIKVAEAYENEETGYTEIHWRRHNRKPESHF